MSVFWIFLILITSPIWIVPAIIIVVFSIVLAIGICWLIGMALYCLYLLVTGQL